MSETSIPGSYLFRDPSDQTVYLSVSFTIENGPPCDLGGSSDLCGPFSQ